MGWRIGLRAIVATSLVGLLHIPAACGQATSFDRLLVACANITDDSTLKQAADACTKVITSGKLDAKGLSAAYFNRGTAFHFGRPRDYLRAIADYSEAIRLDPGNAAAYEARGLAYWLGPDWNLASASKDFDAVIRLQPGNLSARGSRCTVLALQRKRLDQALSDCNAALQTGDQPELIEMRAMIHFVREDDRSALADYDAAVRFNSRSANSLYARGVTRMRLGAAGEGRKDIEAAVRLDRAVAERAAEVGIKP